MTQPAVHKDSLCSQYIMKLGFIQNHKPACAPLTTHMQGNPSTDRQAGNHQPFLLLLPTLRHKNVSAEAHLTFASNQEVGCVVFQLGLLGLRNQEKVQKKMEGSVI